VAARRDQLALGGPDLAGELDDPELVVQPVHQVIGVAAVDASPARAPERPRLDPGLGPSGPGSGHAKPENGPIAPARRNLSPVTAAASQRCRSIEV